MLAGFEHDWFKWNTQFLADVAREVNEQLADQVLQVVVVQ